MADTLKKFSGPTVLTTAAVTQYTAPANTVSVIRSIHVSCNSATTESFTLSMGTDSTATRLYSTYPLSSANTTGAVFDFNGVIVIGTTQIIQAFASSTGTVTMLISGVEVF